MTFPTTGIGQRNPREILVDMGYILSFLWSHHESNEPEHTNCRQNAA
jgi:hypothetical protein